MTDPVWIDASDIGTILHENPYKARRSLLLQRCRDRLRSGATETKPDTTVVPESLLHGQTHEAEAMRAYESKRGPVRVPEDTFTNPTFPGLRGRPDGIRTDERTVVEIKCPMTFHPPEIACIPKMHMHQMQAYLHLLDYETCDYVQYDAWNDRMDIIPVGRDDGWWDRVRSALDLFREQVAYYSKTSDAFRIIAPRHRDEACESTEDRTPVILDTTA